jgi:hypothetical protein
MTQIYLFHSSQKNSLADYNQLVNLIFILIFIFSNTFIDELKHHLQIWKLVSQIWEVAPSIISFKSSSNHLWNLVKSGVDECSHFLAKAMKCFDHLEPGGLSKYILIYCINSYFTEGYLWIRLFFFLWGIFCWKMHQVEGIQLSDGMTLDQIRRKMVFKYVQFIYIIYIYICV